MPRADIRICRDSRGYPLQPRVLLSAPAGHAAARQRLRTRTWRRAIDPQPSNDEPIPTRIMVRLGDGWTCHGIDHTDRPVINGVDLVGATDVAPDDPTPITRWRLSLHRPTGRYSSTPVPDRTAPVPDHLSVAVLLAPHPEGPDGYGQ